MLKHMSGPISDQPIRFPVQFQTWQNLTFLHLAYDVATMQRLVPDELTVQQWNGVTWVGITPFRMVDARPTGLLPPLGWDVLPKLNVRAYVRRPDGTHGLVSRHDRSSTHLYGYCGQPWTALQTFPLVAAPWRRGSIRHR